DGNLRPTGEGRSESLGSDRIRSLSARRSNRTRQAPDMSWATFIEWMPHLMATRYGVEHAVPHLFRDFSFTFSAPDGNRMEGTATFRTASRTVFHGSLIAYP